MERSRTIKGGGESRPAPSGWRRLLPASFWAAMAFTLVMALLPQPIGDPPDKVLHILAFLVLTPLAAAAYPRLPLLLVGLGLAAFGGLIELAQLLSGWGRDGNLVDWLVDCAAIAAALAAVAWARARRRRRRFEDSPRIC